MSLRARCAALGAAAVLLSGCSGAVEIDAPELAADDEAACADFVDALPRTLAEQRMVDSEPEDAPGAAFGDPAIVVTCGVGEPDGFGPGASCEVVEDVRWYLPDDEFGDEPQDLTLTAAWDRPRIEVRVPASYWPNGGAAVKAALAPLIKKHLDHRPGECV